MVSFGDVGTAWRQIYHASWLHNPNPYPNKFSVNIHFCCCCCTVMAAVSAVNNATDMMLCYVKCCSVAEKSFDSSASLGHADAHKSIPTLFNVRGIPWAV